MDKLGVCDNAILVGHHQLLPKAESAAQPFDRCGAIPVTQCGNDACVFVFPIVGHGSYLLQTGQQVNGQIGMPPGLACMRVFTGATCSRVGDKEKRP